MTRVRGPTRTRRQPGRVVPLVRPARAIDLPAVRGLMFALWPEEGRRAFERSLPALRKHVCGGNGSVLLVAVSSDRPSASSPSACAPGRRRAAARPSLTWRGGSSSRDGAGTALAVRC
jgi:hypothetical protein